MSELFSRNLIAANKILTSAHGYEELAADSIYVQDILASVESAKIVEEYSEYRKGPCVLVLQYDVKKKPIHVLWGIPFGKNEPAVVVTAHRPKSDKWSADFSRRKK